MRAPSGRKQRLANLRRRLLLNSATGGRKLARLLFDWFIWRQGTLAHGDIIPWHYHRESTDHYFVLRGTLTIETRGPDNRCVLTVGERYKKTRHRPPHFE
jgi:hypothetical protein